MASRSFRDPFVAAVCLLVTMVASLALAVSWLVPLPDPILLASGSVLLLGALAGAVSTYRHARRTRHSLWQALKDAVGTAGVWVLFWS